MKWIKPADELPPQGKKILYFSRGDIYVVQRFGKYWFPIPFSDSKFIFNTAPELWADIIPPGNCTGKMKFILGDEVFDLDELEMAHNEHYKIIVKCVANSFGAIS